MPNDSSDLPFTENPPGQATLYTAEKTTTIPDAGGTVTTTDIEFDYSAHLDRIVTALEQMSLSMAFIADKMDTLTDRLTEISISQQNISERTSEISNSQQTISGKISSMESHQNILKDLSLGSGIHTKSQYEWLSMAAIYKLFKEQNVDFASIKSQVDALPKENGFE